MSDNLPSPFTVSSMEGQGFQFVVDPSPTPAPPPPPPPQNYTLGNLLADLRQFGEAYQRDAESIRQQDPILQRHGWLQLGAFVSAARESLLRIQGFEELRTFAFATWGEGITLSVCRRIVGALVNRSSGRLSVTEAEKLTLADAASQLMARRMADATNLGQTTNATSTSRERNDRFGGWEIVREAPEDLLRQVSTPATGRLVVALDPPTLDGVAHMRGETRYVPRREHLALAWKNGLGREVLHQLDRSGCLLMSCQHDATWLPEGWEMDVFPTGWTLPHLESWFEYALGMAKREDRGDIPPGSDRSPKYAPTPRGLVTHAHLIVRHLGLPGSPTEPRGPMDRAGCLADLWDVLGFFRRALQATASRSELPKTPSPASTNVPTDLQEPPAHPDGVEGGCWIWWRGQRHDIPKGNGYKLLAFMWARDSVAYDDLIGPVFDDPVEPQTIRSLANKANNAMRKVGIPWKFSTDSTTRHITKATA
jgi:hypothetical protein